ncbi:EF-P lysine aminoacylase GenX [Candidatus Uhrbacteria bacterium]|nr:EF-P lysine aminoacylase GenX [Candidatus Uhrbacteria bacterium]
MNIQTIALERQTVADTIRQFFRARDYVEVDTPILVRSPGMEPNLMPFETELVDERGIVHPGGLITSPEYSMKKLLGRGMERIFTIAPVFRNGEELGGTHQPEFRMLEWYRQGADYQACMDETEALVRAVGAAFSRTFPAFRRLRVRDLFLEYVGVDLDTVDATGLRVACGDRGLRTDPSDTESDLFYRLFLSFVEPRLGPDPVFVYDYPKHQASLSQLTDDGKYGQRFELYVDGLELCNGFTELTDVAEQRKRFLEEAAERRDLGKTVFPLDEEFLSLLPRIRQPAYGNALGVERLHMVATGKKSIEDVLLFPASQLFGTK